MDAADALVLLLVSAAGVFVLLLLRRRRARRLAAERLTRSIRRGVLRFVLESPPLLPKSGPNLRLS